MITQNDILQAAATIASGMYAAKGYKGTQLSEIVEISSKCAYQLARTLAGTNKVETIDDVRAKMEGPQNRAV